MLKSIENTRKLFKIEGLEEGKVDIEATQYLLSLSENEQIEILEAQLADLNKDLEMYEETPGGAKKGDDVHKAQLLLLIQVIQGLLSQI